MYAPSQKIWVAAKQAPIDDETLKRLTILVPPDERTTHARCDFEVLAFHTASEWDTCNSEPEMKRRIRAKFRCYDEAEEYAQKLLLPGTYYYKVVLRV